MLILSLAVFAVVVVMLNTGETITVSLAAERLTEVFGAAAADTFAE